jgi:hypothetical protein
MIGSLQMPLNQLRGFVRRHKKLVSNSNYVLK